MRKARHVLNADALPWLLEIDRENPGVRYFVLRDLLGKREGEPEVRRAQVAVMRSGPVPAILRAQAPEGYWGKPGGSYSPKYRSTIWQVIWLAELGADPADPRVRRGCEYVLAHSMASNGAFSFNQKPVPSGSVHCINGNLVWALHRLGFGNDPRVRLAVEWIARATTGEGPIEFYASGTSGPAFACGINLGKTCAWGANKSIRALLAIPARKRTPLIARALEQGAAFLLSRDPAAADYPYTERVSSTWFRLGFPLSYWSDVLETAANLAALGFGQDPRLDRTWEWILGKQDRQGRWPLENTLNGKLWADIEAKRKPSKWVTLRALRAIKESGRLAVPHA
jgi:hypothetical protein